MKNDKRWQIQYNKKKHNQKIMNAKSSIPKNARSKNSNKKKKKTFASDPKKQEYVKDILKKFNLQQYRKQLENCGYDECLLDILKLSDREYEKFLDQMNFLPGHTKRFNDMMKDLKEENNKQIDKENQDINQQNVQKEIVQQNTQVSQAFQYLNLMIDEIKNNQDKNEKHSELDIQNKSKNEINKSFEGNVNNQDQQNFQQEILTLHTESIKESYFEDDFETNDFNLSLKSQNQSTLNYIANIIQQNLQLHFVESTKEPLINQSLGKRLNDVPLIKSKQQIQQELFVIQEVSEHTSSYSFKKSVNQSKLDIFPTKEEILTCVYQFFANKNITDQQLQQQIFCIEQEIRLETFNSENWRDLLIKILENIFKDCEIKQIKNFDFKKFDKGQTP